MSPPQPPPPPPQPCSQTPVANYALGVFSVAVLILIISVNKTSSMTSGWLRSISQDRWEWARVSTQRVSLLPTARRRPPPTTHHPPLTPTTHHLGIRLTTDRIAEFELAALWGRVIRIVSVAVIRRRMVGVGVRVRPLTPMVLGRRRSKPSNPHRERRSAQLVTRARSALWRRIGRILTLTRLFTRPLTRRHTL